MTRIDEQPNLALRSLNQIWHFILQKSNFLNLNVIFRNAKIDIPFVPKYVIIRISIINLLWTVCIPQLFSLRKVEIMAISYNGLWKILIDKNMYRKDLAAELNISSATMAKMGKGESVSIEVLERICEYLECNIGDIMSFERGDQNA